MILARLEQAFKFIGEKVISVANGQNSVENFEIVNQNIAIPNVLHDDGPNNLENRRTLNNLTKQDICNLAVIRYNIELNVYNEKKHLITEYLELQDCFEE